MKRSWTKSGTKLEFPRGVGGWGGVKSMLPACGFPVSSVTVKEGFLGARRQTRFLVKGIVGFYKEDPLDKREREREREVAKWH